MLRALPPVTLPARRLGAVVRGDFPAVTAGEASAALAAGFGLAATGGARVGAAASLAAGFGLSAAASAFGSAATGALSAAFSLAASAGIRQAAAAAFAASSALSGTGAARVAAAAALAASFALAADAGGLAGAGLQPVFVGIAQSNSVSASQNVSPPSFPAGTLQMGRFPSAAGTPLELDKTLIPAVHPVDSVQISTQTQAYNYLQAFAERFYADPAKAGQTLVLIPCAIGGSSLQVGGSWDPVSDPIGPGLQDLIDRINAFYSAYPGANDGVFVNCQGESDIILRYTELYSLARARVLQDCQRITHQTPWVEIGLLNQTSLSHLARAQFPNVFRKTAFVSTAGKVGYDGLHFDNNELDDIGSDAYDAWETAKANTSTDLGLGAGFFVPTFANRFASTGFLTLTDIAGGIQMEMPADPTNFSRAVWQISPSPFRTHSSYVVTFNVEMSDLTDTVYFAASNNNVLSSNASQLNLQEFVTAPNTVTPFRLVVNTGATSFATTPYIGFRRSKIAGAVATTIRITDFKVAVIEGARVGWE